MVKYKRDKVREYTKDELLQKLRDWAKEHNKSPTSNEILRDFDMPHPTTYIKFFGTWNKAKEEAGLKIFQLGREKVYTNSDLIRKLQEWAKKHGKSPTIKEIDEDDSMPDPFTYRIAFGTWNKAKEIAGLDIFEYESKLEDVGELLKEWLEERKGEISENTIDSYLRTLYTLEEFLNERSKRMSELDLENFKEYVLEIKEKYSLQTLKMKFSALRNFLEFVLRKALLERKTPLIDAAIIEQMKIFLKKQLRTVEDDKVEAVSLTDEEVEQIKEKLKDYPFYDIFFRLDLNLGLRATEFKYIKIKQGKIENKKQARINDVWIDMNQGRLLIYRQKTRKRHLVSLTEEMKQLIEQQLSLRELYNVKHEYLFFSKTGGRMSRSRVFDYYEEISDIVGLKVTSHKVRRTMATLLGKRGIEHIIVRDRLGHKPSTLTGEYQRYPIDERLKILQEKVGIL